MSDSIIKDVGDQNFDLKNSAKYEDLEQNKIVCYWNGDVYQVGQKVCNSNSVWICWSNGQWIQGGFCSS